MALNRYVKLVNAYLRVKADIRNPLRCLIRLNLNFHPFSLFESDRRKDKP